LAMAISKTCDFAWAENRYNLVGSS
jgi:hypothetical protein